jgi:YegS/Rv2252/BmrU family lipid kinase
LELLKKEISDNLQYQKLDFTNKWLVILNPNAGCGKGEEDRDKIIHSLEYYKVSYTFICTSFPRHAISLAVKYIGKGYRKIIVCGGDGTLNEVVNGIFIQESTPPKNITVGVIPVGTGNDWVKTFGIPVSYLDAVKTILENKTVEQDIGKIIYNSNAETSTRFFANIAGFGFDALVAKKANKLKEEGKKGIRIYLQSLISSYFSYKVNKAKITIDNLKIEDYVFSASIGIGRYSGGGMMQTPFAVPNNGKFQVTLIKKIGLLGVIQNLRGLYSGDYVKDKRVSVFHCKKIKINGERSIQGEVDGENLGNSSFYIELLEDKLRVVYGDDKFLDKKQLLIQDEKISVNSEIPLEITRQ